MNYLVKFLAFAFYMQAALSCNNTDHSANTFSSNNNADVSKASDLNDEKSLTNYKGDAKQLSIKSSAGNANFKLVNEKNYKDDYGMAFPSAKGSNWHWVRELAADSVINLKWYGAKGLGLQSYKDDSAALVRAVNFMKTNGGGKLYIPAASSFYGFNGNGIVLGDNMEIYGDGEKSEIKHINPESGTFYRGVIFFTTTYGPGITLSVIREPNYSIQDAPVGQQYVVLKNQSDAAKLKTGSLIVLGGKKFFKNDDPKSPRLGEFEINEIIKIENNKVSLKYPLTTPLTTAQESPAIINVNANTTYNDKLGVYDRLTKNIYIHDLKLSQADYNMIKNTPYDVSKPPSNLIALGGSFESKFQHIYLEGAGTFGGNMWDRCDISNINISGYRKVLDLGYGSCNTKVHEIDWQYKENRADTTKIGLMYLNEATHDIEIYNLKASGNWAGKNLIQIGDGANHINLHDIVFNLPEYTGPKNACFYIRDYDNKIFVHHITIKNITIRVKSVGQFIRIEGDKTVSAQRNLVMDNVKFEGNTTNFKKYTVDINNAGNIVFKNITIPQGNFVRLENSEGGEVDNLNAPNSYLINTAGNGTEAKVAGAIVKGTMNNDGGGNDNNRRRRKKQF